MFRHDAHLYKKKSRWPTVLSVFAVSILVVVLGVGYMYQIWYKNGLKPVTCRTTAVTCNEIVFEIEPGSGTRSIAASLAANGLVSHPKVFELYYRLHPSNGGLKAGSYKLSPSMSIPQIVEELSTGKDLDRQLTITPGLRLDQIKKRMIKAGFASEDIDRAFNPALYTDRRVIALMPSGVTLEGYVYPDTYNFNSSTTAQDIIGRAIDELNEIITDDVIAHFKGEDLTLHEALTLSSIIEKEVASIEDRQKVAQVFLKRVNTGQIIGSDATYVYGAYLLGVEAFPDVDSPYNTRKYAGLPPGPINNVTKSAIEALAYPASTNYLYFVTGDDGINYFSVTQAEHESLTAKHCKIACAPGYVLPTE